MRSPLDEGFGIATIVSIRVATTRDEFKYLINAKDFLSASLRLFNSLSAKIGLHGQVRSPI